LQIPRQLLSLAKLRAQDQYVDQSTALRQLLHLGAEEYILQLTESGRLSVGKAAEILELSVQDMYRLAEKHGVRLGASAEQQGESQKTVAKLFKKKR